MIQATELRLGNLIRKTNHDIWAKKYRGTVDVVSISSLQMIKANPDKEYFEPIKITEEILKEIGFEFKDLGDEPPYEMWKKEGVEVWGYNGEFWVFEMVDQAGISNEYHYLHQLQNFFYIATLKELVINPDNIK